MSSNSAAVPSNGRPENARGASAKSSSTERRASRPAKMPTNKQAEKPKPSNPPNPRCHVPQIQAVADCFISRAAAGDFILWRLHEVEPKSKNPRFQAKRTSIEDPNTLATNKGRNIPKTRGRDGLSAPCLAETHVVSMNKALLPGASVALAAVPGPFSPNSVSSPATAHALANNPGRMRREDIQSRQICRNRIKSAH
jgi:hypothetical protein